jgi:hypothetical protein
MGKSDIRNHLLLGGGEGVRTKNCKMNLSFVFIHPIIKSRMEMGAVSSTHGRDEMYTQFWLENLKGKPQSEELCVDCKMI